MCSVLNRRDFLLTSISAPKSCRENASGAAERFMPFANFFLTLVKRTSFFTYGERVKKITKSSSVRMRQESCTKLIFIVSSSRHQTAILSNGFHLLIHIINTQFWVAVMRLSTPLLHLTIHLCTHPWPRRRSIKYERKNPYRVGEDERTAPKTNEIQIIIIIMVRAKRTLALAHLNKFYSNECFAVTPRRIRFFRRFSVGTSFSSLSLETQTSKSMLAPHTQQKKFNLYFLLHCSVRRHRRRGPRRRGC